VSTAESAGHWIGKRRLLAELVAEGVDQVPGIRRSGALTLATLYPGGRVEGVVSGPNTVTVHIAIGASRFGEDLRSVGDVVRRSAERVLESRGTPMPVHVRIDDIEAPPIHDLFA
jgi:hypothetical protein